MKETIGLFAIGLLLISSFAPIMADKPPAAVSSSSSSSSSTSTVITNQTTLVPFPGTITSQSSPSQTGADMGGNTYAYGQTSASWARTDNGIITGNLTVKLSSVDLGASKFSTITSGLKNSTIIRQHYSDVGLIAGLSVCSPTINLDFRNMTGINYLNRDIVLSGSLNCNVLPVAFVELQFFDTKGIGFATCNTASTTYVRNGTTFIANPCTTQFIGKMGFSWEGMIGATYNNSTKILTVPVGQSFLFDPLALDGSNSCFALVATASCTLTLTTANANDVCVANTVVGSGNTFTNPTDVIGMTFSQRYSHTLGTIKAIESYGIATGTLSAAVITFTGSVNDDLTGIAYCISGANTSSPFDPNASLPKFCDMTAINVVGTACSQTFSTSNANDFLITYGADNHATNCYTATSGYTLIQDVCNGSPNFPYDAIAQYKIVSATQSSVAVPRPDTNLGAIGQTWYVTNIQDAIQERTVTAKIKLTTLTAGAPSATITWSGCQLPNATMSADGFLKTVTVIYSCAITFTEPADGANTRYRFNISPHPTAATSISYTTCASGTCTEYDNNTYYQLQNTYKATPQTPTTWDAIYTVAASGTFLGSASNSQSLPNTANGGGAVSAALWYDYNLAAGLPSLIGNTWAGQAPLTFTQTTGGNTNNVNYIQNPAVTTTTTTTVTTTTTTTVTTTSTQTTTTMISGSPDFLWMLAIPFILILIVVGIRKVRR